MRPIFWSLLLAAGLIAGIPYAAFADAVDQDSEASDVRYDQDTIDWLNSWGIKRNPDGSLQSMNAGELENYWRQKELDQTEQLKRREKIEAVIREQIEHDNELVEKNPGDPKVHFEVALHNQNRGDGEGAIIHMLHAEKLFKEQKDQRGLARARKSLREFYRTYGYLPEDFDLTR